MHAILYYKETFLHVYTSSAACAMSFYVSVHDLLLRLMCVLGFQLGNQFELQNNSLYLLSQL